MEQLRWGFVTYAVDPLTTYGGEKECSSHWQSPSWGSWPATGSAAAFQCPLLIKHSSDAVATMNPSDAKVKEGQRLIAEAGQAS